MATGPDHYREAERLADAYKGAIAAAEELPVETAIGRDKAFFAAQNARALLDKAQVHATLAVAAAQIETVASRGAGDISHAWDHAVHKATS